VIVPISRAFVHIDVGGEGPKTEYGMTTGFSNAINVNDTLTTTTMPPYHPIPNLVRVDHWSDDTAYPFRDHCVDYITMQGAPLTPKNVTEMARCLSSDGKIDLWIQIDEATTTGQTHRRRIEELAALIGGDIEWNPYDEFQGHAGFPKVRIATPALAPVQRNRR